MNKADLTATLDMLIQMMHTSLGIRASALSEEDPALEEIDFSLRHSLFPDANNGNVFHTIIQHAKEKNIYNITDHFYSQYLLMRLPAGLGHDCILAGPYLTEAAEDELYHQIISRNRLTLDALPILKQYFENLPIVDQTRIASCLNLVASFLYPDHKDLTVRCVSENLIDFSQEWNYIPDPEHNFSIYVTEKRYAAENRFLDAVTHGDLVNALKCFDEFNNYRIAPRYNDPIRDSKNLCIILNTLLRKAVEKGVVHPVYLDEISHHYALRIENSTSSAQVDSLRFEMIRKYCLLVKNQSLKNYPPLIRNILNYINLNLSTPLTLKTLSQMFNVNASYLSTLFKRETGSTLTDFINSRRIDTALTLLNTTNIQIQDIAYYIGIEDVNYFTRIFKKKIGVSPTEYKKIVRCGNE